MDAREWLGQIRKSERRIAAMRARLAEYDRLSDAATSPVYGEERRGPRSTEAPFIKWIDRKMELSKRIDEAEKELANLKAEAARIIESMEDEGQKDVLFMRYLGGQGWRQIAETLAISEATAYRWHDLALDAFPTPREPSEKDDSS